MFVHWHSSAYMRPEFVRGWLRRRQSFSDKPKGTCVELGSPASIVVDYLYHGQGTKDGVTIRWSLCAYIGCEGLGRVDSKASVPR